MSKYTRVFKNARLIDGVANTVEPEMTIIVKDDRISEVQSDAAPVPPNATVENLQGKTVLPGLIDTHVHTTLMDSECFPLFLAAGVTTARDVGGKLSKVLQNRADLNSEKKIGPRLLICGPLLDGPDPSFPSAGDFAEMVHTVPGIEAVPDTINSLLKAQVDGIKLYFTLPPDTAKSIIRFVDKRVPVTAHLGYTASLDVIKAGIDGLEHVWISPYNDLCPANRKFGTGASMMEKKFWTRTLRGWEEADLQSTSARSWFDAMADNQVYMGTTLDLLWTAKFGMDSALEDEDRAYIPPMALDRQRPQAKCQSSSNYPQAWDIHPGFYEPQDGLKALEKHQEATRLLHDSGGPIVGGTDCGAIAYPPPGFALLRELELLSESIGSLNAIKSVTSVAATYLRRADDVGAVRPGRYADFLVVDGDPLRDVRELRKLETVYKGGRGYQPEELKAACPRSSVQKER